MVSTNTGAALGIEGIVPSNFNSISRTNKGSQYRANLILEFSEIYKLLKSSSVVDLVDVQFVASRHIVRPGTIRLTFQLKEAHAQYFALLKGLLGFGIVADVAIESDRVARQFTIDTSVVNNGEAIDYLTNVFTSFQREIKFKNTLRVILLKEQEIKRELDELYAQFRAI